MTIEFYNSLSDPDTLDKTITLISNLEGTLREASSVENPSIRIQNSGIITNSDGLPANYCYIPEFGRYYFIVDQIVELNNILRVILKVDVLFTYRVFIKQLKAIVSKSTSNNNKYLASDLWVPSVKDSTYILNFSSGFNDTGEYILITAGG